tara:strand:+ start:400 stop:591 length:192 start_codon:yes stop_codon:yes gene_type:complete
MIPHEYKDFRKKPPKKPQLEPRDYFMIIVSAYIIGTSLIIGDFFTLIMGSVAWNFYENYRMNQ